jgi:hypothetical protein
LNAVTGVPPISTLVTSGLSKSVPVITTTQPAGPLVGENEVMLGGIAATPTPDTRRPRCRLNGVMASSLTFCKRDPLGSICVARAGRLPKLCTGDNEGRTRRLPSGERPRPRRVARGWRQHSSFPPDADAGPDRRCISPRQSRRRRMGRCPRTTWGTVELEDGRWRCRHPCDSTRGDPSASPARSPPETRGSLWWCTGVDRSHFRRLLGRVLTGPDLSLHKLSSFSPAVTDTVQARSAPLQ